VLKRLLTTLYGLLPASLLNRAARTLQPHFTVTVAAVVTDETGRVLLLKHNFRGGDGWGIPGGFLTKDEQPEDGLRRELREEIGLEVKAVRLALVRTVTNARQVQIVYRCRPEGEPRPMSIEVERYAWFQPEALPDYLNQSQGALIEQAILRPGTGREP
jgi:ADP-ribose pyrophosphatase YjhB (NUDIX family)